MRWQSPWAWTFLAALVALAFWYVLRRRNFISTFRFSSTLLIKNVQAGIRAKLAVLPTVLKYIALFFAIVALARPQKANTKVNKNVEGIDIMIALDVSDSMNIEDMQPVNRITACKSVIHKFIKGRGSDRVGLVIFAGESYTRCPLTLDYDVLLESLDTVTTDNIKQGTAIGVALANAVARLKDSTARSRVIILLTDGESNMGTIDPETAADIAKGYGIKVYTIGAGVNGQAQLPVYTTDAFGRKVKHYQPIHSTINENLLQLIAKETGGRYFRAADTDTLRQVFNTINQLEKTKIQVNEYVKFNEEFYNWLFVALLLYVAQFLLSETLLKRVP